MDTITPFLSFRCEETSGVSQSARIAVLPGLAPQSRGLGRRLGYVQTSAAVRYVVLQTHVVPHTTRSGVLRTGGYPGVNLHPPKKMKGAHRNNVCRPKLEVHGRSDTAAAPEGPQDPK